MKIALILVGTLAAFTLGVVLIGSLLPREHTATRRAIYRAPAERLFALMVGPQDWRPDVARAEVLRGAGTSQLLRETDRHGEAITYELLDVVKPTSLTRRVVTENLPYSGAWSISLLPVSGSTVVRITENGAVYNPLFRFVSRFVIGHTRTIDAYLVALGKASSENVTPSD